ncbi:MAG: methyltransferase domain-containing protein [Burkholderiales bacterium]|nr:methyltransferase domain-containing protein [Burkholderiales bacterium]
MKFKAVSRGMLALLCIWCVALTAAAAQTDLEPYKPRLGQPGRDVVWIPSPEDMVEKMLDMVRVTPQDYVIDLGSGDGRNVIAAARRGAQALGVEYNPDLVELSKRTAGAAGVAGRATFVQGDMFKADISRATVLVLFLIPSNLDRLRPKFLDLKPGTRIISNTYEIGGGWEPEETGTIPGCATWCVAHVYIVPARVAGTWRLPQGELSFVQQFQYLAGTYETSGLSVPIDNAWLHGDEIHFTINAVEYSGRVEGDRMRGVAKGRTTEEWTAVRVQ